MTYALYLFLSLIDTFYLKCVSYNSIPRFFEQKTGYNTSHVSILSHSGGFFPSFVDESAGKMHLTGLCQQQLSDRKRNILYLSHIFTTHSSVVCKMEKRYDKVSISVFVYLRVQLRSALCHFFFRVIIIALSP